MRERGDWGGGGRKDRVGGGAKWAIARSLSGGGWRVGGGQQGCGGETDGDVLKRGICGNQTGVG